MRSLYTIPANGNRAPSSQNTKMHYLRQNTEPSLSYNVYKYRPLQNRLSAILVSIFQPIARFPFYYFQRVVLFSSIKNKSHNSRKYPQATMSDPSGFNLAQRQCTDCFHRSYLAQAPVTCLILPGQKSCQSCIITGLYEKEVTCDANGLNPARAASLQQAFPGGSMPFEIPGVVVYHVLSAYLKLKELLEEMEVEQRMS